MSVARRHRERVTPFTELLVFYYFITFLAIHSLRAHVSVADRIPVRHTSQTNKKKIFLFH